MEGDGDGDGPGYACLLTGGGESDDDPVREVSCVDSGAVGECIEEGF